MNIRFKSIKDICNEELRRKLLFQFVQISEYEMSDIISTDVDDSGNYAYPFFEEYFLDSSRAVYFAEVDSHYAGMAMVNHYSRLNNQNTNCIAEFIILKKYRRKGIGRYFSNWIFEKHLGNWEVFIHESNKIAQQFWNSVIQSYTCGKFEHKVLEGRHSGILYMFCNEGLTKEND